MAIVDYYYNLIVKLDIYIFNCNCKTYNILVIKGHFGELKENTLS